MRKNLFYTAAGFVGLVVLTGCSHAPQQARLCPQTVIVRSLERVQDYGQDSPSPENLVTTSFMESVDGSCKYIDGDKDHAVDPKRGVDLSFSLKVRAERGPRLGGDRFSVPYFIAIVDAQEKVVAKDTLTAEFVFPEGKEKVVKSEPLHVFIPLPSKEEHGEAYRVLLGFQLTEAQLHEAR